MNAKEQQKFYHKTYQVIYADPPWAYRNRNTGGSMSSGSAAKYRTMTKDEICGISIPAARDSVLFLWTTVPMLPDALDVMREWGFTYKTMLTWRKVMSMGMGFWWRGQCEHLLFGVRGKVRAFRMQESNFAQTRAGRHSSKPVEFRQLIERATRSMPDKLELFARERFDGWDAWGDEIVSDITIVDKNGEKI